MNKSFISILLTLSLLTSLTTGYAMGSAGEDSQSVQKQARVRPERSKPTGLSNIKKNTPDGLKDGTYTGSAEGYSGTVTVQVTVKGGKIVDLKVLSHTETPGYYEKGASVIQRILAKGNLEVDTVSGATFTSRAIIEATANALAKAGGKAASPSSAAGSRPSGQGRSGGMRQPAAAAAKSFAHLQDGTYIGTGQGYAGSLSVEVVIANGVIASARMISGNDDAPYINNAMRILDQAIGKKGTDGIDVVSGATFSSNGLLNALNDALEKAGGSAPEKKTGTAEAAGTGRLEQENKKLKEQLAALKKKNAPAPPSGALKDGVYQGSAKGYNTLSTVEVVVKDGKIQSAKLISSDDDKAYLDKALPLLAAVVKAGGTTGVDTVSGATFSSTGLLDAVNDALSQASGRVDDQAFKKAKQDLEAIIKKLKAENEQLKKSDNGESEPPADQWQDGAFTGTAQGYKSAVTVRVTVKNKRITSLDIVDQSEDTQYFAQAEGLINNVLSRGSTAGVDVVSGATFSSKAILKATVRALRQSAGLKTEQDAGGNPALEEENKRLKEEIETLNQQLASSLTGGELHDGTFMGSARGYGDQGHDTLKLSITVKDKKITSIDVLDRSGETEPYYSDAIEQIIPQIIAKQGVQGVDVVSGATFTSNALKNAVIQAMKASFAGAGSGDSDALIKALEEKHAKEIERLKAKIRELEASQESEQPKTGLDLTKISDGVYTGKGYGYHGSTGPESMQEADPDEYAALNGERRPIEVEVTVAGGKLTEIKVLKNAESPRYRRKPFKEIPKAMIAGQRLDVDVISGSTYTSKGLIEAVKNALSSAPSAPGGPPAGEANEDLAELRTLLAEKNKALDKKNKEIEALKHKSETEHALWGKALKSWSDAKDEMASFFGTEPTRTLSQDDWSALMEALTKALEAAQADYEGATATETVEPA